MKLSNYRSVPSLRSGRVVSKNSNNTFRDIVFNRNRSVKNTSARPAGRNQTGRITVRHQGGGHKQAFRLIDWARSTFHSATANSNEVIPSFVVGFSYDPQRSARLAQIFTPDNIQNNSGPLTGTFSYIIAPAGLQLFQKLQKVSPSETVSSTSTKLLSVGDVAPLSSFEVGDFIHAVEAFPGQGPVFARSAGTFCQFRGLNASASAEEHSSSITSGRAKVRLPSGSIRLISQTALAAYGVVGNQEHNQRDLEKAGRSRWLGRRPSVRGVARNPVDHPHGGGQGKTSGGRPSVTFKSWPTKGQPTRHPKRNSSFILVSRKQAKKS